MSLPALQPGEPGRPGSRGLLLGESNNRSSLLVQSSRPNGLANSELASSRQSSMPELNKLGHVEPQAMTQIALPASVGFQSSMLEFNRKDQAKMQARNRFMVTELGNLGLIRLPSCQRMRAETARDELLRAHAFGDLKALRNAMRAARCHLGMEDSLVKQVGKMLSEAERCACACRDCLASETLQALPSVMSKIEAILLQVKLLGLGAGLWKDPYLGSARRKLSTWREHRSILEGLAEKVKEGPMIYCDAWAQLAVARSAITSEFGHAVTKELLSMPYVASELVYALARVFEKLPDDPEDPVDQTTSALMSISNMLSQLERAELDDLLLKPSSESGAHSLQLAANHGHIFVFIVLYQTITGEVLVLERGIQSKLQQQFASIATGLGDLLQLEPGHLCLRTSPSEGLTLRLLVHAEQSSAQQAQQALGGGAKLHVWRRLAPRVEELSKWSEVGDRVKGLYNARQSIRRSKATIGVAEIAVMEAIARVETAKVSASEAAIVAEDAASRWFVAKSSAQDAWKVYVDRMKDTRDEMGRDASTEADVKRAKDREAEAEIQSEAAKKCVAKAEMEAAEASEASKRSQAIVEEKEAAVVLARESSTRASEEHAAAVSRYQAFLCTPVDNASVDSRSACLQSGTRVPSLIFK